MHHLLSLGQNKGDDPDTRGWFFSRVGSRHTRQYNLPDLWEMFSPLPLTFCAAEPITHSQAQADLGDWSVLVCPPQHRPSTIYLTIYLPYTSTCGHLTIYLNIDLVPYTSPVTIYLPYTSTCTGLCPLQHKPIMIMVNGHCMCPPQPQHTPIITMMLMAVMRSMIVQCSCGKTFAKLYGD